MKERLKTLYNNGLQGASPSIGSEGVMKAVTQGWITTDEAVEIIGEENALSVVRNAKLTEISKACNAIIMAGVDVQTANGLNHFNLSIEDQSNINNLFRVVELGGTQYPYQADDGSCTIYSASEIVSIYITAQSLITTQLTYHNGLKAYVLSLDDAESISAVVYGMDLPEPYATELSKKLAVAQEQMEAIVARLVG